MALTNSYNDQQLVGHYSKELLSCGFFQTRAEVKSKKLKMMKMKTEEQPVEEAQSGPDVYFREQEEKKEAPQKVNMSGQQVLTLPNQNYVGLARPKIRELIPNVSLHLIEYECSVSML